jgi:hypothetical protein
VILAAAGDIPGGLATVLATLITTLGGIAVAFLGIYHQAHQIRTKVNGQMTALLEQLQAEQERSLKLAGQLAAAEERERLSHGDT